MPEDAVLTIPEVAARTSTWTCCSSTGICAEKNEQVIELLELDEGSIRVASYLTELLPKALLERKLLDSIRLARAGTPSLPEASPQAASSCAARWQGVRPWIR